MSRLEDQLKRMQDINLSQQQTIRKYERLLERIGDEQVEAGVDPDLFREYYPGYMSPEERNAKDRELVAAQTRSQLPRAG